MPDTEIQWSSPPSKTGIPNPKFENGAKIIWLIAIVPVLFVLATWDSDGILTNQNAVLRHFSLPVVVFEIAIVWLAVRAGFEPQRAMFALPRIVRWAFYVWLFFSAYAAVSAADQIGTSVFVTLRYLLQGLVLGAVIFLVSKSPHFDQSRWLEALTIGAVGYLLALVVFVGFIPNPDTFHWVNALPSGTNVRQIGNNLSLLAIAPLAALLNRESRYRLLHFIALSAIICFIGWTGSRAGLLGIVAGVFAGLAAAYKFTSLRNVGLLLLSIVVGLSASIPLFAPAPEFGVLRIASSISQEDISSGRIEMWRNALFEISRQPLTGHGSGTYREHMFQITGQVFNHPHNFILQFGFDWGVVGALAMMLMLAWLGGHLWRLPNQDSPTRFIAAAGLTTLIAIAMIDGTLFYPLTILTGIALIAPALGRADKLKEIQSLTEKAIPKKYN